MLNLRPTIVAALLALAAVLPATGGCAADHPSPLRFQPDIDAFARAEAANPSPVGAVVITGSSSIRMWHPRIHQDLASIQVIARGFGGSTMNDLAYYADQLISRYQPRAVAIYEGDNDIANGVPVAEITAKFVALTEQLRKLNPDLRIYFISVKPSLARWSMWPKMQEVNRAIKALCEGREGFFYIDVASALLNEGAANPDIYLSDGLHLNERGYQLWSQAIAATLEAREMAFEPGAKASVN